MPSRTRLAVVLVVLASIAACSDDDGTFGLGGGSSTTSAATATTESPAGTTGTTGATTATTAGGDTSATTLAPTTTTTTTTTVPEPTGPRRPVPIMEGLATFDSYRWQMSLSIQGPTSAESTEATLLWITDKAADARFTRTTMTQTGPDFDEGSETVGEVTQIGTDTCNFDGDTYTYEEVSPQQREILDVGLGIFDLTVIPGADAQLVGEEEIAGIPTHRYRFSLPGLGQDSGAVVAENTVEYWISIEGDVLLRYRLVVETRSGPSTDPDAEVFRIQAGAQLVWANQPGEITFPQACLAQRGS